MCCRPFYQSHCIVPVAARCSVTIFYSHIFSCTPQVVIKVIKIYAIVSAIQSSDSLSSADVTSFSLDTETPTRTIVSNESNSSSDVVSLLDGNEELLPVKAGLIPKSRTAPAWKYFIYLDPLYSDYESNKLVCLLCREQGINRTVAVGKVNPSPSSLLSHLRVYHHVEHEHCISKLKSKSSNVQSRLTDHLKAKADVMMHFRNSYCRWLVECNKPLTTGSSLAFQMMIKILNGKVVVPERREVLKFLDLKRLSTRQKIKELIGSKYFSITTDHWTSISNDNYGAITVHFIDDNFKLRALVISFEKHIGGCSGEELQEQLYEAMNTNLLDIDKLSCIVSDTASNMNRFGDLVTHDKPFIGHHYVRIYRLCGKMQPVL
jgi:hypothetical protein